MKNQTNMKIIRIVLVLCVIYFSVLTHINVLQTSARDGQTFALGLMVAGFMSVVYSVFAFILYKLID